MIEPCRIPDGSAGASFSAAAPAHERALAAAPTVDALVDALRPEDPLVCLRPHVLRATATRFVGGFPGRVLYAVKCNPSSDVMAALHEGGVNNFDVASLDEVARVRTQFPEARLCYMNPVKSRPAIRDAYFRYGVRDFSLDSFDELFKILDETDRAGDLGLHVRLAMPKGMALHDLSGKFGIAAEKAPELLKACASVARLTGIAFHVGSQCTDPGAYAAALALTKSVVDASEVKPDVIDVGGGFAMAYDCTTPPDLQIYFDTIKEGFDALGLPPHAELWCEPGRALVGAGASVVVQVLHRRGNELFLNDGLYGTLSDPGYSGLRYPTRLVPVDGRRSTGALVDFKIWGPTCDTIDQLKAPMRLPADVREGDFIEIGQLGSYSTCLRTGFNGFHAIGRAITCDGPLVHTPGLDDPRPQTLFFFGSLIDPDMLRIVLGREPHGITRRPARLTGMVRRRAFGEHFPILLPAPDHHVDGVLVEGLDAVDLARLRFYETSDYVLRPFRVEAEDDVVEAGVFVSHGRLRDSGEDWDLDRWATADRTAALAEARALMRLFGRVTEPELQWRWPGIKAQVEAMLGEGYGMGRDPGFLRLTEAA